VSDGWGVLLDPPLRAELDLLYTRYARTVDAGDAEAWAACFTPDGRFTSSGGVTSVGRDEIAAFARGLHEQWRRDRVVGRHWTNGLLVEEVSGSGEDMTLRTSCYGILLLASAESSPAILVSSIYADRVVRRDGAWRFAERVSRRDTPVLLPE
jgi:uncharacterized protein (TIGR02246 family)